MTTEPAAPSPRPGPRWRLYLYRLGLVIGVGLFGYHLWRGYTGLQAQPISGAVVGRLGLAVLVVIGVDWVQIAAWVLIMRALGVRLPGMVAAIRGYMVAGLARYIPGGIWGLASRSQWLREAYGVPFMLGNLGALLEMGGMLTGALLLVLSYGVITLAGWERWLVLALAGLVGLGAWLGPWAAARTPAAGWLTRRGVPMAAMTDLSLGIWAGALLIYGLVWSGLGLALLLIAQSLGAAPTASWLASAFAYALAWSAGLVFVLAPAGLGVRELALTSLLASLLGLGPAAASATAVLARFAISLAETFWLGTGVLLSWLRPEWLKPPSPR